MIRKLFLFLISLFAGFLLFLWVGHLVGWQEIVKAFLVFTGWQGIVILTLTVCMAIVGTWRWQEILKGIGVKVPFRELWRTYLAGFSIRYLAPVLIVGSEIFQGQILKNLNSVAWAKGIASIIVDRIIEWTTNLLIIFLGAIFLLSVFGLPLTKAAIIFGGGLFSLTILFAFFYFKNFKRESIAKSLGKIFNHRLDSQPLEIEGEMFNFFKPKKKEMWRVFGLSFLRAGIMLSRTWLLISFLGKSISFFPALSILSFSYLASVFPIPAALGSHEVAQAFAFNYLKIGANVGTAFTMIIRGAELILSFFGLLILFRLGIKLAKITIFKRASLFGKKHNL